MHTAYAPVHGVAPDAPTDLPAHGDHRAGTTPEAAPVVTAP